MSLYQNMLEEAISHDVDYNVGFEARCKVINIEGRDIEVSEARIVIKHPTQTSTELVVFLEFDDYKDLVDKIKKWLDDLGIERG